MLLSVIEQCVSHLNINVTFEDGFFLDSPNIRMDCEDDVLLIVSLVSFQVSEKLLGVLVAEIE